MIQKQHKSVCRVVAKEMQKIDFNDVLSLHESCCASSSSVGYARRILNAANVNAKGKWVRGSLKRSEIENIILTYHQSEGGNMPLSPRTGIQLKNAIQFIQQSIDYKQQSPSCWGKIKPHLNSGFSPIFLARQPVKDWQDHQNLQTESSHFHLDGLHRLVGWGLGRKFDQFFPNEQIPGLVCYVAVNI